MVVYGGLQGFKMSQQHLKDVLGYLKVSHGVLWWIKLDCRLWNFAAASKYDALQFLVIINEYIIL